MTEKRKLLSLGYCNLQSGKTGSLFIELPVDFNNDQKVDLDKKQICFSYKTYETPGYIYEVEVSEFTPENGISTIKGKFSFVEKYFDKKEFIKIQVHSNTVKNVKANISRIKKAKADNKYEALDPIKRAYLKASYQEKTYILADVIGDREVGQSFEHTCLTCGNVHYVEDDGDRGDEDYERMRDESGFQ